MNPQQPDTALEYLKTYGWILLVIAIITGAIYASAQEEQNRPDPEPPEQQVPVNDNIQKYSMDNGDTCYTYDSGYGAGISCIRGGDTH